MPASFALDSIRAKQAIGQLTARVGVITITSGSTYNANSGVDLGASLFGMSDIVAIIPLGGMVTAANAAVLPLWNSASNRMRLFKSNNTSDFQELGSGALATEYTGRFMVLGTP